MPSQRADKVLHERTYQSPRTEVIGEIEHLNATLITDEAGLVEFAGSPSVLISIHVGPPVDSDCRRGGERRRMRSIHGDIEIIPARMSGTWENNGKDIALVFGLGWKLLRRVVEERGGDPARLEVRNRFQERDPRIEHIGWALKAEMESGYPCGRSYTDGLALALAAAVVSGHSSLSAPARETGPTPPDRALRRVLEYVDEHLNREIGLAEMAVVWGVSVSQFTSSFRRSVGVSPHQYLIRRRVERATTILRRGKLPIARIALETGFCHQSHLAKHMRRALGVSPQDIRNSTG